MIISKHLYLMNLRITDLVRFNIIAVSLFWIEFTHAVDENQLCFYAENSVYL